MSSFKTVNLLLIFLLAVLNITFGQSSYNNCDQALVLCPQKTESVSNVLASKTLCPFCEDDFTLCFTPNNTIWMQFETNETGGDVTINFTNVQIENGINQGTELQATIFNALAPCDGSTYSMVGTCELSATGNFSISGIGLLPATTYYVVVNGAMNGAMLPAQGTMDVSASGNGFDRPTPAIYITSPTTTLCPGEPSVFYASLLNCSDSSAYHWYRNGDLIAITDSIRNSKRRYLNSFEHVLWAMSGGSSGQHSSANRYRILCRRRNRHPNQTRSVSYFTRKYRCNGLLLDSQFIFEFQFFHHPNCIARSYDDLSFGGHKRRLYAQRCDYNFRRRRLKHHQHVHTQRRWIQRHLGNSLVRKLPQLLGSNI